MERCRTCSYSSNIVKVKAQLNNKKSKKISLCQTCLDDDINIVTKKLHKREKIIGNLLLAVSNFDTSNKKPLKEAMHNMDVEYAIYSGQFELILSE